MASKQSTQPLITPAERSIAANFIVPLLLIITLSSLAGVLWCGFVNFDDPGYVTDNPHVQQGLTPDTVKWALTSRVQNLYHPITLLSFALDSQIFGLEPAGFHLENLLLHCANVVLLYRLLRKLTGAAWKSALVSALWAVHPLRVESVAWITERKDVLMAFLGLLSFYFYALYVQHGRRRDFLSVCVFLILSLLVKPTLMVMPALLLLLDFWPLGRTILWHVPNQRPLSWRALILEKMPVATICAVCIAVYVLPTKEAAAPANASGNPNFAHQIVNVVIAYAQYVITTIDFRNLAVFYPVPASWPIAEVIASACLLLGLTLLALFKSRQRPWLAVGWLWFVVLLLPVVGLVYPQPYLRGDRYSYLPSIGLLIGIVWSLPSILGRSSIRRWIAATCATAVVLALALATADNVKHWQDSATLWRQTLDVTHNNYIAEDNYALALDADGQPAEAMPHFMESVRLNPKSAQAHFNYGGALERSGDIAAALAEYRQALAIFPRYSKASLAAGMLLMKTNQFAEAAQICASAAQSDPAFIPIAHCSRGADLLQHDRAEEAIAEFRQALHAQPDYFLAQMGLGVALLKTGQPAAALMQFQAAQQLDPNNPSVANNLNAARAAASTQSTSPPH